MRERPAREEKAAAQLALDAIEERTQSARVRSMISGLTNPDFDVLLEQRGIQERMVNITPQKREHLLARFAATLQTFSRKEGGHAQSE